MPRGMRFVPFHFRAQVRQNLIHAEIGDHCVVATRPLENYG
ncbi:hypothetical protein SFR_3258 [Streptomyces sp. FR-008]|nr:hypothetical protein SFR_3258 [Streptomyces sp. FR-008]